jgi:hypothetical protein
LKTRIAIVQMTFHQVPRPSRAESEFAERDGARGIVTALPAPDLSMKDLRIVQKKNERPIFGKTNPIQAEGGSMKDRRV